MEPKEQTPDEQLERITFKGLPERVPFEDMVIERPATEAKDPKMGRDTHRDFLMRWLG